MELEFDKEIDAILRKARSGTSAAAAPASDHVDADAIAAFAENALPDKAKDLYMAHFADCGRCRKQLSHAILTRNTADATAADLVAAPIIAAPWYSRLFRMPSLAVGMGALVVVFSGILGYVVIQNRSAESNSTVAQRTDRAAARPESQVANDMATANTNAASNTAIAAQPSDAAPDQSPELGETRKTTGPSPATEDREQDRFAARQEKENQAPAAGATVADTVAPVAAAPPKPAEAKSETTTVSKMQTEGLDKKDTKDEDKNKSLLAGGRAMEESRARRDAPAAAAKSGPARSGPIQTQNTQINTQVYDMPVTRIVGGKTFNNRDGAWYDSAYRSQATTNVRRGSDEFKKLDSSLRSIANNLNGVVVVVWKAKAYRIQ